MFRFATPEYLYLLVIMPFLIALFMYYTIQRRKRLQLFGNPETTATLMKEASPKRVRNKFILITVAVTLIILTLARPQFGSKLREVTRRGVEIMLAVDVSNSMLAEDFKPSRLERTKYDIDRLTEQLKEDRIGVIVFAGDAYVQLPITGDYLAARNFVKRLSPNMVSRQGTAIGTAIDLASNSFTPGSEGSRVIVLISDGENHEDNALAAARAAVKKGIKVYTIGIGTTEGVPITIDGETIKDEQGNMVVSKLDEKMLQEIAIEGGGSYIRATNSSVGLKEIVDRINEIEKKELKATVFEEYNEQFQYILAVALVFLILEMLIISRKNRILSKFDIFTKR